MTGAAAAQVHVAATFTGEAASVIESNPSSRAQLLGVFSDLSGRTPQVSTNGGRLLVEDDLSYAQLRKGGTIVGLSTAQLSPAPGGTRLVLGLVPPVRLASAVRAATASQPDAGPLATTMLRSTTVTVRVRFPGGVSTFTGSGASRDGDTVTVTRTADSTSSSTLTVIGDPSPRRWPWFAGGGLLLAAAGFWAVRRRR